MCRPPYPAVIAPCPEWFPPTGADHSGGLCVDCGRVTSRRWRHPDGDLLPWCAGTSRPGPDVPTPAPAAAAPTLEWPVPDPPRTAYNSVSQRHAWTKVREHHRVCGHCRLWVVNESAGGHWYQRWRWPEPDSREGTNRRDPSLRVPRCPGPLPAESVSVWVCDRG